MDSVSKSFMYEDLEDPIAVSMFVHSDNYEQAHDEEIAQSLAYSEGTEYIDEEIIPDDEVIDDCEYGNPSTLDIDIDAEEDVENDISDEDGEIIDIIDGII